MLRLIRSGLTAVSVYSDKKEPQIIAALFYRTSNFVIRT